MEDSDEFKWAVKVVIKRQMRDLINQLKDSGEEIALMSVNLEDDSCSLLGTPNGEWFLSEQKNLSATFVNFCKNKSKKDVRASINDWLGTSLPQVSASSSAQKTDGTRRYTITPGRRPKHLIKEPNPTIIKITVPLDMAPDLTEEELAALIGRLFAAKVVSGKMNTQATRFDEIMDELALRDMKAEAKRIGGRMKTPSAKKRKIDSTEAQRSTTRSGRKVSNKFLEGLNSLKKVRTAIESPVKEEIEEEERTNDEEITSEERTEAPFNLLEELHDLDVMALKRFVVCTSDEEPINVLAVELTHSVEMETVAGPLIQAIDKAVPSTTILDMKKVQLIVSRETNSSHVVAIQQLNMKTDSVTKSVNLVNFNCDEAEKHREENQDGAYNLEDKSNSDNDYILSDDSDYMPDLKNWNSSPPKRTKPAVGDVKQEKNSTHMRQKCRPKKKQSSLQKEFLKCEHCSMQLLGKKNLMQHVKRVHLKIRNYVCDICGKGFWNSTDRESHMLAVHTRQCRSCQDYVVEATPWAEGITMKTKRDVICTCGSIVSIYTDYGKRRNYTQDSQTDSNPTFNQRTTIACGVCGKLFLSRSDYKKHARIHTNMKPYNMNPILCDLCGSSFSYKCSLNKHMRSKHGVKLKELACDICGEKSENCVDLKAHKRAHHNIETSDDEAKPSLDDQGTESLKTEGIQISSGQLLVNTTETKTTPVDNGTDLLETEGIQNSSGQSPSDTTDIEIQGAEVQIQEQELKMNECGYSLTLDL